jgi:DNA (cytosine-5)-methyltransferase 3A
MNILSLFDGMSCGQIALQELGVKYDIYYSSETDKHAIAQTQLNFPATVQLGDVERWRVWDIKWSSIDLILAGSPCQGFSIAGKGLAFDDPRSRLFFEFVDILNHTRLHNPPVKFLLENVKMKKQHLRVITDYVGVFPVCINSALVSAQNRIRYYWTNIHTKRVGLFDELHADIPQPTDRGIFIKDILKNVVEEKYYLSGATLARLLNEEPRVNTGKSYALTQKNCTTGADHKRTLVLVRTDGVPRSNQNKAGCVTGGGGHGAGNHSDMDIIRLSKLTCGSYAVALPHANEACYRRLTPTECARLQTIPDWYKWACSDTQQYRLLGNGWTVEIIKHILQYFIYDKKK